MGAFFSSMMESITENHKVQKAYARSRRLFRTSRWAAGHLLWTFCTGMIVLGAPVLQQYDRECNHFELAAAMQAAQIAAAAAGGAPPV